MYVCMYVCMYAFLCMYMGKKKVSRYYACVCACVCSKEGRYQIYFMTICFSPSFMQPYIVRVVPFFMSEGRSKSTGVSIHGFKFFILLQKLVPTFIFPRILRGLPLITYPPRGRGGG